MNLKQLKDKTSIFANLSKEQLSVIFSKFYYKDICGENPKEIQKQRPQISTSNYEDEYEHVL